MKYDEIGYWSEVKLDIVREYASAYSVILSARNNPSFHHIYIDAFAGAGVHLSRKTGEFVPGSPVNALAIHPRFKAYYFIDLDGDKFDSLKRITANIPTAHLFHGDCNSILLKEVFPNCLYADYRRALCLLDPYGLHVDWEVIHAAGQMKSFEVFLNFPVADMNRNVLWNDPRSVSEEQAKRMSKYWGDDSWKSAAYDTHGNLFGFQEKTDNIAIARAFQSRLKDVAGFNYVPDPIPMRNKNNAIVYYLFFASQNTTGARIVEQLFGKYRNRNGN